MLSGGQLIRQKQNKSAFTLTTPLITDQYGNKIGKSEKNAIQISIQYNVFYNLNSLLQIDDNIQNKISIIANIKFNHYLEFVEYMLALLYSKNKASKIIILYNNILNNNDAIDNFNIDDIEHLIPILKHSECTIGHLMTNLISSITSKLINLYIEQKMIILNNKIITSRNVSSLLNNKNIIKYKKRVFYFLIES
jgi:tyrosyl-tRNA synthetase